MITTIKVNREAVAWLNTLKGHLEYISGKRLTLNDAFMSILAETDWLYLKGQRATNSKEDKVKERINQRIEQFWGDSKEKPSIVFTDTRNIVIKEKELRKSKKL